MPTATTMIPISADDVAAILAGDYDDVAADVRQAVLDAIIERGDTHSELVESLPVTVRACDDGSHATVEVEHGDDYESAAQDLWDDADYGEGDYCVSVSWEATDAAGEEIASGSFDVEHQTEEPDCPESDDGHDWTAEHEGGCTENPGVWSTGGTSMLRVCHCRHCGMDRTEKTTGCQKNPGDCDTTTYSEPDGEWVAEHYGDEE